MDPSPLGSPAGADGVSGVDTNALDEALAESPIERATRLRRKKRLLARQQRNAGRRPAEVALLTAQKYVSFAALAGKIPDAAAYLASIKEPSLVLGVASGLENLGERYFDARSEEGKEILAALDAKRAVADAVQPMEAEEVVVAMAAEDPLVAAAAAPTAVTETVLRPLQASQDQASQDDEAVNRWVRFADEDPRTWRDRLGPEGARRWTGKEECPPWDLERPSKNTPYYWRGDFPPGATTRREITWGKCKGDPVMEAAWRDAGKLRKAVHEIYKEEHDAFEACLALSKAEGQNSGRSVPRVPYAAEDAYASEQRAATEKDIEEDKKTYKDSTLSSLKAKVANRDDILKALAAANGGLDWSALFKLNEKGWRVYVAALARSSLPHIKGMLERTHLDHLDGGWKNEHQAIREMLIRGLIEKIFNERLPGIEWFKDHDWERAFFDTSYIKGALCFDRDYGQAFTTVFEIKKDWDWFGKSLQYKQDKELKFIKRDLLSSVVMALDDDDVQLEPWDAIRSFLLNQRYPDLTFKHAPSSGSGGNYCGRFSARFLDRGVVEMVVDHVGLATFRGDDGKWYRRVGIRGLLPEDVNRFASGYEWMTVLELEKYVDEYLANALYKTNESVGRVGIRPNFFLKLK